jgi:hypothetical protein
MPVLVDTADKTVYKDCLIERANGDLEASLIYEDMRMADMLECIGLGHHPRLALEDSYKVSTEAWTLWTYDYQIVGSFGIAPSSKPTVGIIWLLGTYRMHLIRKTFVKHSKDWVRRLMGEYDSVTNLVCKDNELSMRWLTWLGSTWSDCGIDNYKQFTIYKQNLN